MGLFTRFSKNKKELDDLLNRVANNAANNYKDAAQGAFKDFLVKFQEMKGNGQLNEKQISYYKGLKAKYEQELKGFHH